ncbi:MAG: thioredoxin TrxC [Proteobacteria bacterium]|nr:thioredoxin TrxC [Pseudomonadota bacterium]
MIKINAYTFRCSSCGTKNRIPHEKAGQTAKCGKCGSAMDTSALLVDRTVVIEDRNFNRNILESPLPVLLDCWAPWCGPCKMIGPILEDLAMEWRGRIRIGKLNVDENPATANKFEIRSIPTLMVFDHGKRVDTLVGALPKGQIVDAMAAFL